MSWDSVEARRAARLLDFHELLDDVARQCTLSRAALRVRDSVPITNPAALESSWDWWSELADWLAAGEELALGEMLDLPAWIGNERSGSGPLNGEELAAVGAAAASLAAMRAQLLRHQGRLPHSAACVQRDADLAPLAAHLAASLEPDGRLRDTASPALLGLRSAVRAAEQRWRQSAQQALADAHARGIAAGAELVLRGDRFCIAVRAEQRRDLAGIVHDRSGSGQTVFIEPNHVVEAGNEWVEAKLALGEEEARILAALNAALAAQLPELLAAFETAVALDAMRARVRYGRLHGGLRPRFVELAAGLRLRGFRHPSLVRSLGRERVVPLDVELSGAQPLLLVTGPNAGGKTVAMKAVGLSVWMAQSTIPLSADSEPQLPCFTRVLVESGDDQSIADSLSSFSAHLTHMREILHLADAHALLLLDELCSGTDPHEGVALARACLEHIDRSGAFAIVSTHYGELKALAQELPRLRNASMAYDAERLLPRFTLQLDRPGASHALEIARKLDLPEAVIARARALVGSEHLRYEELLLDLERERAAAQIARAEAARLRDEAATRQREYDERIVALRRGRKEQIRAAQREAEGILRNARSTVERLLERVRHAADLSEAKERAAQARESLDEGAERLARAASTPLRSPQLRADDVVLGMRLRHLGLDVVGTVLERRGERVTLELGGRRMSVELSELGFAQPEGPSPKVEPRGFASLGETEPAVSRLDVRGLDGVDAWSAVDRALDRCLLENRGQLTIVHGKGSGALRRRLSEQLRKDPRVRRAALGGDGEFDEGVTVVEL